MNGTVALTRSAMEWLRQKAIHHGWKIETTDVDRRLYTNPYKGALLEVRYEHRGRVLDAIYYNKAADRDQYVMFGDQAKKETIEWILRTVPTDLGRKRGPLHYNNTLRWKKARKP